MAETHMEAALERQVIIRCYQDGHADALEITYGPNDGDGNPKEVGHDVDGFSGRVIADESDSLVEISGGGNQRLGNAVAAIFGAEVNFHTVEGRFGSENMVFSPKRNGHGNGNARD